MMIGKRLFLILLVMCFIATSANVAFSKETRKSDTEIPTIPIEVLFGNPDITDPQLSPDGKYISYLAPYEGVMNLWVGKYGKDNMRPVTKFKDFPLSQYYWSYAGYLVFSRASEEDPDSRLYSVDPDGEIKCLTPEIPEGEYALRSGVISINPRYPDEILIYMNSRNQWVFDYYSINLRSGEKTTLLEAENPMQIWYVDNDRALRAYSIYDPQNAKTLIIRDDGTGEPETVYEIPFEDQAGSLALAFSDDNKYLIMTSSCDRNATGVIYLKLDDGSVHEVASDRKYDTSLEYIVMHPVTNKVQAVGFNRERVDYLILDETVRQDFEILGNAYHGDLKILSRTLDDKMWLVSYHKDNGPTSYYIYNRKTGGLGFLFYDRKKLAGLPLVEMKPVTIQARDGVEIPCYLSVPHKNLGWKAPGPLVMYVHHGPQLRENWEFNPRVQLLANRGYAVLLVNYRGSAGYGKEFRNMGNGEYGGKMQNDLTDAVNWAINEGIADPDKIVIFGKSFGGYSVLMGLTNHPELYAGGIDMVGMSSMISLLETTPLSSTAYFEKTIGPLPRYKDGDRAGKVKDEKDCTDEEIAQIEYMKSISPFYHLEKIEDPILIQRGAKDIHIPIDQSNELVEEMKKLGIDVEYVVYDDEGHHLENPENRLDFYRRVEKFLARVLGGRRE